MLAILLLSLSGDLQPNTEVLLGVPGTPRISLDVQKDGWIDLSVKADQAAPTYTEKLKMGNDTFIFQGSSGQVSPSVASSADASGNTRIKIADALAAAGSGAGGALTLKEYTPALISVTLKEAESGNSTEITVTRKDGNIVIGTPDTAMIQMPVTIKSPVGTNKR